MKDLTKGNIYKTFLVFAVPLVLSGLLSHAYNIVDTIIAGKFIGQTGLAATGSTSALVTMVHQMFCGYGTGFALYIAKLFGAKEYYKIKESVVTNYIFLSAVVTAVSLLMILGCDKIFDFLKLDEEIRPASKAYFTIYMLGNFLIVFNSVFVYIMNALGSTSFSFLMSVLSTVLNIGGNIFSIVILKMGAAGLALSTVFSAFVVNICYFFKLRRCFSELGVMRRARFNMASVLSSVTYSLPVTVQQTTMYFSSFLISPMINALGSAATAAYTVVMKVNDISTNIYCGSAKVISNYTAQCIGARKYDKIRRGVRVGFLQGVVFLSPVLFACIFWAEEICAAFFPKNYSGEGLALAVLFVRVYLPFVFFNVINNLFHCFFRGVKAMGLLLAATFIGSLSRFIATLFFVRGYGMEGVYIGWVIGWATEAVFALCMYFFGVWKRSLRAEMRKMGEKI